MMTEEECELIMAKVNALMELKDKHIAILKEEIASLKLDLRWAKEDLDRSNYWGGYSR